MKVISLVKWYWYIRKQINRYFHLSKRNINSHRADQDRGDRWRSNTTFLTGRLWLRRKTGHLPVEQSVVQCWLLSTCQRVLGWNPEHQVAPDIGKDMNIRYDYCCVCELNWTPCEWSWKNFKFPHTDCENIKRALGKALVAIPVQTRMRQTLNRLWFPCELISWR